jgi:5-methylcytosine-specific restriction protein A
MPTDWRRTRAAYLEAHPFCIEPGCAMPASRVEHVVARIDGGTDDWDNLRAYCHLHHLAKAS